MKKIFTLVFFSILFTVIDNALMPFFAIKGFYPSLIFVFIVSYAIVNGSWEGLWLGVFCGLLQDIYFFYGFGVNSLVNMIICVIAGKLGMNIFKKKMFIPIMSVFGFSIIKGMLIFAILYICKVSIVPQSIFYTSVYNALVAFVLYRYIYKLCQKDYMVVKWKF